MLGDAFVPVLLERGGADEDGGAASPLDELPQEITVGLLEHELHGVVVRRLHVLQELPDPLRVRVRPRVELRRVLLVTALDVELHGGGVERRAVVKLHAFPELERVGERVLGDVPRRRELRNEPRIGHVVLGQILVDQPFVHLLADPPRDPAACAVRVEDVEFALLGDDEGAATLGLLLRPRRTGRAERAEEGQGGCGGADLPAPGEELSSTDPPLDERRFEHAECHPLFLHRGLL